MNIFPPPLQGYGRRRPPVPKLRRGHPLCNGLKDCLLLDDNAGNLRNLVAGGSLGVMGASEWTVNELLVCRCVGYINTTDFISQGTVAVPTTGSLAIWARPSWAWNDNLWHTFFSVTNGADSFQFRVIKYTDNNIYAGWVVSATANNVAVASSFLVTNTWNLLVFTWNSSNGYLYHNGIQVGIRVGNDPTWDTTGFSRLIGRYTSASSDNGFNGRLFFFQLWNRVLTPAEARLLWDKPFDHFEQPASVRAAFTPPATGGRFRPAWVRPGVIIGGGVY